MAPLPTSGTIDHPALGRVRYITATLSTDPDEQVAQTIGLMRKYAIEDARTPGLKADSIRAWRTNDPLSDTWEYLRRGGLRGMQFVQDEQSAEPLSFRWNPVVEVLIRPVDQAALANPQGDCDDFAQYGAAHLIARGVPCAFVTVAADAGDPSLYSHVYLVAYPTSGQYAGMRVPIDLSHGAYLGWEVPNRYGKRREWPIEDSGLLKWAILGGGAILAWKLLRRAA